LAAAALGLALAPRAAPAQSLLELYEAAHNYDASYLAARALADSAIYRVEQTRALNRASASLSGNVARVESNPTVGSNFSSNGFGLGVNGRQPLFNRSNDATIAQAERTLESSLADLDTAEQDLMLRVSQAYFDVLGAQDTLQTTRANKAANAEQLASAKRNFEVGTATITDTREAQARYDLARFTQIQAENDLTTKRILLDQTVGRANIAPNQLAAPLAMPALVPANVDDWVARAEAEHPLIRKARIALEIAKLDTDKAKAARLPTVALNASVGRSYAATYGAVSAGGASFPFASQTPNLTGSVGVTLNLPLFTGFQVQNRIKETLVLEDKSTSDLDAARRGVVQATRQLFYQVGSAGAQVSALEAAESSSKLALEATQLGFKVGVRVNIDVLNAQAQLYTTQAQLAKARYDLIMAGLRLRQASGRLTPGDVTSVNGLLLR
jgi:outer membrane protein